jgi:hypothetical protein
MIMFGPSPSQSTGKVPSKDVGCQDEGSSLDIIELQNELLNVCSFHFIRHHLLMGSTSQSGLHHILENLRETIAILESMQSKSIDLKYCRPLFTDTFVSEQFADIHTKFTTIQERVTDKTAEPLTDLFVPGPSPPTVIQQWGMLTETSMSSLSHTWKLVNFPK